MNANKKTADRLEELQKKRKNWLQRSDVIAFLSDLKKNCCHNQIFKKVSSYLSLLT